MSRALFLACAGFWKISALLTASRKTSTAACQQTGAVTLLACTVTVCEGFGSATAGNGSLGPTESVAWLSAHRDTLCKAACVLLLSVDLLVHEIFKREVGRSSSQVAVAAKTRRTGLHFLRVCRTVETAAKDSPNWRRLPRPRWYRLFCRAGRS